jgi:hypothetical protein
MWVSRGDRRYYYRSKRLGNRVVRQYVGTGPLADLAAALDRFARVQRQAETEARRTDQECQVAALQPLQVFCEATDLLARASLLAAGYHQHDRGEWRRRRHDGS